MDAEEMIEGIVEGEGRSSIPFLAEAEAEAFDDSLVGIHRDGKWIEKRARELYQREREKAKAEHRLPEFIPATDLPGIFRMAISENSDPEGKLDKIIKHAVQARIDEAVRKDRAERPVDEVIQEQVDRRTKEVQKELTEKSLTERRNGIVITLRMIKSAGLALLIPILGFVLPAEWKSLQMLPIIGVFWLNWKPMRELNQIFKDIEKERKNQ